MWTLLALLAASAVTAVIGAVATNSAQKKANEANIQLQREANEANKEMQASANETNIQLAQDEMAFNSAEAQKQRDFELMMSDTAVQRRMKDLGSAGVNPMLAIGDPAQMASGYAASASSARVAASQNQAAHVAPVDGAGTALAHISSMMQSAAFMMALRANSADKLQGTQSLVDAKKYAADKSYEARTAERSITHFYRNKLGEWIPSRSSIYR